MPPAINPLETTADDRSLVMKTVAEFARDVLDPIFEKSEVMQPPEVLSRLLKEMTELGLIPDAAPTGLEIWADLNSPEAVRTSLSLLEMIARRNAALALALHLTALARYLASSLQMEISDPPALVPPPANFFIGEWLAHNASGKAMPPELRDRVAATLCGASETSLPILFHAPPDWQHMLYPVLTGEGELSWLAASRESLRIQNVKFSHGLNELPLWKTDELPDTPSADMQDRGDGSELFRQALMVNSLALPAIALGATRRAVTIATEYASGRVQGGRAIAQHPAVQQLLGRAHAAVSAISTGLDGAAKRAAGKKAIEAALAFRAVAHPLLCDAANAAMQVMGGYGYMQDMGVEKVVRDNNHLRLLYGSPREIERCLAAMGGQA